MFDAELVMEFVEAFLVWSVVCVGLGLAFVCLVPRERPRDEK